MATRLNYALPIALQFLLSNMRRLRPGGLSGRLPVDGDRTFVIVTGAGRSGTSAVARVLHESGVSMGDELVQPAEINPHGLYEEAGVLDVNERVMTELGVISIWRPGRWPWRSTVLAVASRSSDLMRREVAKADGGWKDPGFALTLEAWLPHLPGKKKKIVVCLRSPTAYAESVVRIYGLLDRKQAERQWARQYRRLLDVIRDYNLDAYCVEYDALIEDPKTAVIALSRFIGRDLDAAYVDQGLRHHARRISPEYRSLYEEVLSLGGGSPVPYSSAAGLTERASQGQEVETYVPKVNEIDQRVQAAKSAWQSATGLPDPNVASARPDGIEQTRAASVAYTELLRAAQEELTSLAPPPTPFDRYHEATERFVNNERVAVELMLAAVKDTAIDERMLKQTFDFWQRHCSPQAFERDRRRRANELKRAVAASGYEASIA